MRDSIDDGLAFDANNIADPTDDVLYYSNDCFTTTIRKFDLSGNLLESFPWGGSGCYNSGLAIGGQLLYQGSDGCSHVWVVDKVTKAPVFNFSTIVAGDPNFRDEDLECDTSTFASLGKHVMWSKKAYAPMRAHAFEIPFNSCGVGGLPAISTGRMTGGGSIFTTAGARVTHGFELHCNAADLPNNLEVNSGGDMFHLDAIINVGCYNDPSITSGPGSAGFNTISGSGTGAYNGSSATVVFVFTDAGEPGTSDTAKIIIKDASQNIVLTVAGKLQNGNQQAHK
jgi:hypothetical protein